MHLVNLSWQRRFLRSAIRKVVSDPVLSCSTWFPGGHRFDPDQDWWEEWKNTHREFRKAFPDYHFTIKKVIQEGEYVAHFGTTEATFEAEFPHWELRGIAPTGEKLSWDEAWWRHVVDGKFADGFMIVDGLSRLQQMGVLPTPEEANQE